MKIASEKDVKREVKKLLDAHLWFWWMPPANGYGKAGISDFNAVKQGVFMVVETKFGSNKPTALQIGFCNSVAAEKGIALVVNEKNLNQLASWLELFDDLTDAISSHDPDTRDREIALLNCQVLLTEDLRK